MSEDDEDRPSEPFLERLTAEERTGLEELAGKRTFPKDSILMFQDDEDDRLLLLLSGRVKVTRAGPGDHALLLAIRGAGELLGELAFIERLPRIATVTALETVEALVLPAGRFQSYLERNPRVALVLTESVAARLRESNAKWMQFAALDTLGRLASRIVELADRYGEPSEDGVVIPMPISQEDLANWTGASRAGVAQALGTMRELGWLQTERRKLIVRDVDALRTRAA